MINKKLLFISILGEPSHLNVENFKELCPSGLEKDWFFVWHAKQILDFGFELVCVDLCRQEQLPPPEDIHAVIIGGSAHIINENRRWLRDLIFWLDNYRDLGRPCLGICGGHQLISTRIFNSKLERRKTGTLIGTHPVELTCAGRISPLFNGLSDEPRFHFANFLHVVTSEEFGGTVLARHGESLSIAIDHGGNWYSVQFHPEAMRQMLVCYCREEDGFDPAVYSENHDGPQLFENFMKISQSFYA